MTAALLERHFIRGSIAGLVRRGHPYDFVETYETVRALYGYQAYYVNLGLWTEGAATDEPGRKLALRVAEPLQLGAGARLVDAGAGLGQAAIDLCRAHALGSVLGLNVNPRQVAFANELARSEGFGPEVIEHRVADACTALLELPRESVDGVIAVECVGHFADPLAFLRGVRHALRPGRRLSFCLNAVTSDLSAVERGLIRASFGFVPKTREIWEARLASTGFAGVEVVDLTPLVTGALGPVLSDRLAHPSEAVQALPWSTRRTVSLLHGMTRRAVESGRVKYLLVSAVSP